MKTVNRKFSCFLIGRESFLLPCAKQILDSGHQIFGIIVTDKSLTAPLVGQIERWADLHQIPQLQTPADCLDFLSQRPFDYLFSLSNSSILSREILALPRQLAINCHDGPLPKYGGINAPAWAILNQERVHGITWHQIAELVDAGDILKQVFFEVEDDETAATLNSKCYEAIISSFPQLITELATKKTALVNQNLQERSYFLSSQKPSPGCILNWHQSADAIDATIRALNFDRQENSIGLPKIAIADRVAIVTQAEISSDRSTLPPGTIVAISADRLQVSTTSEDTIVRQLQTLDGTPLDLLALARQIGNTRSLQIAPEQARHIERIEKASAKHERFWVQRLASFNPLVLPAGDRTHRAGSMCQSQTVPISPQLTKFLTDRQPTWQLADFLVVAIVTYLSRIAQQDCFDLAIKFADLDRQLAGMGNLFATQVPCRIDLHQSQNFAAAFEAIGRELASVKHHQTYARDVVLRYPQLQALSSTKVEERLPVSITRVESLAVADLHSTSGLTFVIPDRGDEWCCCYNADPIDAEQIQQLLERLAVFIDGIMHDRDRSLASLPLLPAIEIERLRGWNDTQVDFGAELCIHQLIEAQVAQTPDAIAVECGHERLTYRELNHRAERLATDLIALGVRADVLVGICVERSIETIVGILGILKAGGAYVPLDPAYPQARLALIMADAAMPIVLTQSRLVTKLPAYSGQIICIDNRHHANCQSPLVVTDAKPDNLAYVIYTSGSTGKPKGVAIEHRSLVNYTIAAKIEYQLTPADRVLQFTSLNFDVSAEEIYTCLSVGATLVLRNDATSESIDTFLHHCRDWRITVTSLPTAFWHELTARLMVDKILLPPSWRLAIIGGEKAAPAKLQAWNALGCQVRLIDAYGPTEATISALMCDISSCDLAHPSAIAIGTPIANVQAYVLDKSLALCPIGSPGELYLGGAGLARGYLNNPELTAQKFIPNPFDPARSARLYRTGDLVKYLPDGKLQFLDRLDEQVKIRGFRIELGEIETVLNNHPGIQEAIAINVTGERQQGLSAYIVPKQQHQQMQWWPSVGEYPLYDELLYRSMTTDTPRNQAYQTAIERVVKDKVVVDIGTGKDAILARLCIEAGAKKVYAIEASETAYQQAIETISQLGLESKIIPIYGYSTAIELPEAVDVCLSEIIGTIGSSEGVAPLLNDARRFLKDDGCMIPHRCVTKIAAMTLPTQLQENPSFQELTGHYTRQIFEHVGQPFDVRLCIKNLPIDRIISNSDTFEDLVFDSIVASEYSHKISLTITKSARFDGFLLWLNLYTAPEIVIDNLERDYSWLPVYFPIFYPGIDVDAGDRIEATCLSWLSDNNINPNYQIVGKLICQNGRIVNFQYDSLHHQRSTFSNHFYQLLFPNGQIRIDTDLQISTKSIRAYLSRHLPAYMVPAHITTIKQLPITPNGKVDRRALRSIDLAKISAVGCTAPRNTVEEILLDIWREVLEIKCIDINDNFFELGGHSLLAIQLFTKIQQTLKVQLPLAILVRSPTVAQLAEHLTRSPTNISSSVVPIQPQGSRSPFFCVHSLDPCLLFYKSLVKYLGTEQPFYGIQPYDSDNNLLLFTTIEEIAAYYLREIRSIQPHGPYYLGGFSYGGYIAFEMAQQLHNQGEKVALLTIFDTPALGVDDRVSALKQLDNMWRIFHKYGNQFIYDKVMNQVTLYRRRSWNIWQKLRGFVRIDLVNLTSAQQQQALVMNEQALDRYQPKIYPGKIILFKAGYTVSTIAVDTGWQDLAKMGIETIEIPGDHASIFADDNAVFLAGELNKCIQSTLTEPIFHQPNLIYQQLEPVREQVLYPI